MGMNNCVSELQRFVLNRSAAIQLIYCDMMCITIFASGYIQKSYRTDLSIRITGLE